MDSNLISFRHKYFWFIATVVIITSSFVVEAKATTYYSDYGSSRTHNITVSPGTHSFQVDGIAAYKNTEWYVNGSYTGSGENDWSDWWAEDPEYTYSFSSGTTQIMVFLFLILQLILVRVLLFTGLPKIKGTQVVEAVNKE